MEPIALITNVASVLVGAVIAWGVARFYYVRASKDLVREARALRELVDIQIRALEAEGLISVHRNASGQPIGAMIRSGPIEMRGESHFTVSGEVLENCPSTKEQE